MEASSRFLSVPPGSKAGRLAGWLAVCGTPWAGVCGKPVQTVSSPGTWKVLLKKQIAVCPLLLTAPQPMQRQACSLKRKPVYKVYIILVYMLFLFWKVKRQAREAGVLKSVEATRPCHAWKACFGTCLITTTIRETAWTKGRRMG